MPWGAKKKSPQVSTDLCFAIILLTHICVQNLENPAANVPTTMSAKMFMEPTKTDYTMATVKEVLTLSQSVAGVTSIPFLQEAIGVALKIIQVCEVR